MITVFLSILTVVDINRYILLTTDDGGIQFYNNSKSIIKRMRSSDYVWVVIEHKKAKSSRKNISKSPCPRQQVKQTNIKEIKNNDKNQREAE